tara:strand:+ start:15794 stop:16663 length:870 start_codon:yes stop_codon:yes gene_type:complete
MSIVENYENKLKEIENFEERDLLQNYCFSKLKEILGDDISLPETFQSYFKISISTNNLSIRFSDREFNFYSNVEVKINKKNKDLEYSIKEYSINNIDSQNINILYSYNKLIAKFLDNMQYDFFIDLFNKQTSLKKEQKKLNSELSTLEDQFFYEKYKKEIQNINVVLKPLSKEELQEFFTEAKKGNQFNLVTKNIEKDNISFNNTIFSFEYNTFTIDYKKVKKDVFMEHLKKAFSFESEVINTTKFLYDKLKLERNKNKNKNLFGSSFDINYIHDKILPLIIKEKSDIF